ncbi:MAG TPA: TolC family protein [Syntrophales bacterium]|nr:TolC family protein [Syntrophales bacterium]
MVCRKWADKIFFAPMTLALLTLIAAPLSSRALTLEEALSLAKSNLPAYQAQAARVQSSEALYKATLGAYVPSLDASGAATRRDIAGYDSSSNNVDVTASLRLFDYKRGYTRDISRYNFNAEQEGLRKSLLDLVLSVKTSFYTTLASRGILAQRKIQLDNAQKNYEVAEGRRKFGVAKLSDVLQVSVRLEQARFNLVQAEGSLKKSLSELSSLIGTPVADADELQGILAFDFALPDEKRLEEALMRRPEILQAQLAVKRAESAEGISTGDFLPVVSGNLTYSRTDTSNPASSSAFVYGNPYEDRSASLLATWNLFDLGKFYRRKAASIDTLTASKNLKETERSLRLELRKSYEDFITASRNVKVSEEQLRQAQQNYDQAFGEYKVGKGDILSVVFAETLLSQAREQDVQAKLNLYLAKALLERVSGIEHLEILQEGPSGAPATGTR